MDNKFILSFLGDFAPVNRIETLSLSRGFEVFDSFRESLDNSAYVIANLECPLTNCKDKIKKIGVKILKKTINGGYIITGAEYYISEWKLVSGLC